MKWKTHADLAIKKTPSVGREEYLDHMTFKKNERPLFTEIFGRSWLFLWTIQSRRWTTG